LFSYKSLESDQGRREKRKSERKKKNTESKKNKANGEETSANCKPIGETEQVEVLRGRIIYSKIIV